MEISTEACLGELAKFWKVSQDQIACYWQDLVADVRFFDAINGLIRPVPEFGGKQFKHPSDMRLYRCLVYLATRVLRPSIFVETGVQNGMSSAFILLGLHHNQHGHLHSIDLPPVEDRILEQGTNPLPADKAPGWIIPEYLRERHSLHLGEAQVLLPEILNCHQTCDIFLHDSDHSYTHMMFETCLAWHYLAKDGFVILDNVEQNKAFDDFVKATNAPSIIVSTFLGEDRTWQHGIVRKAAT